MDELMQFLKENPVFYLATTDGYLPRVRPMGFCMVYNGNLCLAIGRDKAMYDQLLNNTNLELCVANDRGEWVRVQGTVDFDDTPQAKEAAFKVMPQLADLYNEATGRDFSIVYLDHISARLFSMSGTMKVLV